MVNKLEQDSREGFPEGYWELVRDGEVVGTCGEKPDRSMETLYQKMGIKVGRFVSGPNTKH